MKLIKLLSVILFCSPFIVLGQSLERVEKYKGDSCMLALEINTPLAFNQIVLGGRANYEYKKFGKFGIMCETGYRNGCVLFDLGVGYGYRLMNKEANSWYVNGYYSYTYFFAMKSTHRSPSLLLELEGRKRYSKWSLYGAVFCKVPSIGVFSNDIGETRYDYVANPFLGIRIGFMYQIKL